MKINCEYKQILWTGLKKNIYTCWIDSVAITRIDERTIKSISGQHLCGKSDKDVEAIRFHETIVTYFPRGLHKIFPRLILIYIFNCRLKEIIRDDLKGLENLEQIYLNNNRLKTLPSNLFDGMPMLRRIEFWNNELEFVSSKLLRPIKENGLSFTLIDFRGNKNIDAIYCPGRSVCPGEENKLIFDLFLTFTRFFLQKFKHLNKSFFFIKLHFIHFSWQC